MLVQAGGLSLSVRGLDPREGGYSVQPQTQTVVFAQWQSAADVPIWGMFHRVSVLPAMQRDSSGFYLIADDPPSRIYKGQECV